MIHRFFRLLRSFCYVNCFLVDSAVLREKLETAGREMLNNMAQTNGARKLENGAVLHVLEQGPGGGQRPTASSVVLIHYHGTLPDGTVFDSTMGGEPAKFPLAQVIPGWREGVLNMKTGQTAMLGIPPEQAYGAAGTPDGRIPGGATLFFVSFVTSGLIQASVLIYLTFLRVRMYRKSNWSMFSAQESKIKSTDLLL